MKTELFEEDQHDSHENISFDVEPEIKTEPDEQNFKKSQTNSKTDKDESRDWNFDEKLDKENYENCKKCDKLSKGESTEKLRHSRNCNERAGYFILLDVRILKRRVLYICVSFWLLAHLTRDLSQAEKKITVVTS